MPVVCLPPAPELALYLSHVLPSALLALCLLSPRSDFILHHTSPPCDSVVASSGQRGKAPATWPDLWGFVPPAPAVRLLSVICTCSRHLLTCVYPPPQGLQAFAPLLPELPSPPPRPSTNITALWFPPKFPPSSACRCLPGASPHPPCHPRTAWLCGAEEQISRLLGALEDGGVVVSDSSLSP